MRAIRNLKPRYKNTGTSCIIVFVIIKVVPQSIVVSIKKIIAIILLVESEALTNFSLVTPI